MLKVTLCVYVGQDHGSYVTALIPDHSYSTLMLELAADCVKWQAAPNSARNVSTN